MIALMLLASLQFPKYTELRIDQFARRSTVRHVCTDGLVALLRHEDDGDWHYRLVSADGKAGFIVAEVTLRTPLPKPFRPRVGDHVRVCGMRTYDDHPTHKWWEVHPVEQAEILGKGRGW